MIPNRGLTLEAHLWLFVVVLMADPNWNRGFYYDGVPPHNGMKLARRNSTIVLDWVILLTFHRNSYDHLSLRSRMGTTLRSTDALRERARPVGGCGSTEVEPRFPH